MKVSITSCVVPMGGVSGAAAGGETQLASSWPALASFAALPTAADTWRRPAGARTGAGAVASSVSGELHAGSDGLLQFVLRRARHRRGRWSFLRSPAVRVWLTASHSLAQPVEGLAILWLRAGHCPA